MFAYLLDRDLTVEYAGHGKRVYRKGEALLEAMTVPHAGQNTGSTPVRILAVFLRSAGTPETVVEPASASPQ